MQFQQALTRFAWNVAVFDGLNIRIVLPSAASPPASWSTVLISASSATVLLLTHLTILAMVSSIPARLALQPASSSASLRKRCLCEGQTSIVVGENHLRKAHTAVSLPAGNPQFPIPFNRRGQLAKNEPGTTGIQR